MSDGKKVDISKIRPGDKVTLVPLEVIGENWEGFIAVKDAGTCPALFTPNQIAAHHPAPREFQVGDRGRAGSNSHDQWVIEHIAYGRAWLSRNKGQEGWLWSLDDLTLVEAGQ